MRVQNIGRKLEGGERRGKGKGDVTVKNGAEFFRDRRAAIELFYVTRATELLFWKLARPERFLMPCTFFAIDLRLYDLKCDDGNRKNRSVEILKKLI